MKEMCKVFLVNKFVYFCLTEQFIPRGTFPTLPLTGVTGMCLVYFTEGHKCFGAIVLFS